MDISEVRSLFPYLESGKVYLNHAAISPLSQRVVNRINSFLSVRSRGDIEDYERFVTDAASAKEGLGRLINASPERIAFFDNTSNGLNVLAQGLSWKKGDRIILNDIEFPSNVYPFLNLQTEGVEIDFVKNKSGVVSAEDIIEAVTPGTKLISISFVQFLSGYRADLKKIGAFCRENGIVFCVDAIQGLGALRLDVSDAQIDFLSCGTHKWMMGIQGLSFIYITESLQSRLHPRYVGWTSVEDDWSLLDYDLVLKKTADALQNGTINAFGVYSLLGSLDLFSAFGTGNVEHAILDSAEYLIAGLEELGLKPVLAGQPRERLSGIVSFPSPSPKIIFNALQEENIVVAQREGLIRIAPHFYNTRDELDKALAVIGKALD